MIRAFWFKTFEFYRSKRCWSRPSSQWAIRSSTAASSISSSGFDFNPLICQARIIGEHVSERFELIASFWAKLILDRWLTADQVRSHVVLWTFDTFAELKFWILKAIPQKPRIKLRAILARARLILIWIQTVRCQTEFSSMVCSNC